MLELCPYTRISSVGILPISSPGRISHVALRIADVRRVHSRVCAPSQMPHSHKIPLQEQDIYFL
ncbi:hypothetical protein LZ30DRAFT_145137 [Colletotrichum cereale]|nr:hypothetical protein LZ30DRAFT_145137 [Colletotrichum cereale]